MRSPIILASPLCILSATTPQMVVAADLSVRGFFSQRAEVDSNPDLESSDFSSPALNSITNLGLVVTARTPRTTLTFAPGVNATLQTDQSTDFQNINPRFNGTFSRRGQRVTVSGGVSLIPRLTNDASSSFDGFNFDSPDASTPPDGSDRSTDQNTTNETALEINASANLRLTFAVDPQNSLSSGVTAQARRFSGDSNAFTDSETYGINLGWTHRLDPRTEISVNPSFRLFSSNDRGGSSKTYDLTFGGNRRLTPRISASANAGASLTSDSDGDSLNFVGGARLNYSGEAGSISAGVTQSVDQNEFGDLENRTSAFVSPSYRINGYATVSMPLRVAFTNPLFSAGTGSSNDNETTITIGPSLSYTLNPDWSINTGYRLRFNNDSTVNTTSNLVFLQISRNLNLLP